MVRRSASNEAGGPVGAGGTGGAWGVTMGVGELMVTEGFEASERGEGGFISELASAAASMARTVDAS